MDRSNDLRYMVLAGNIAEYYKLSYRPLHPRYWKGANHLPMHDQNVCDPSTPTVLPIKLNSVFVYRSDKSAFQTELACEKYKSFPI